MKEIKLNFGSHEALATLSPEARADLIYELTVRFPPHVREARALAVKRSQERMDAMIVGMPGVEMTRHGLLTAEERKAQPATPQTLKKRRHDVCLTLVKRGVLDKEHLLAVEDMRELAEIYRLGGGSTWATDRVQGGRWVSPMEKRNEKVHRIYRLKYLPWLAWLSDEPITRETATRRYVFLCAAAFVRFVVQENMAIKDAEAMCGIHHDKAIGATLLRIALDRYRAIAAHAEYDVSAENKGFQKAA